MFHGGGSGRPWASLSSGVPLRTASRLQMGAIVVYAPLHTAGRCRLQCSTGRGRT